MRIAKALEALDDAVRSSDCPTVSGIREVNDMIVATRKPLFEE